jgi:hypothetical protein
MRGIVINGIRLDSATAKRVAGHPGGGSDFSPVPDNFRRFDEHLYQTPAGAWFVVRPLDPSEARAWLEAHDDTVLLHETFPAADAA